MKTSTINLCGLAAVKAQFESAPDSIVRLFFDEATSRKIAPMCNARMRTQNIERLRNRLIVSGRNHE